MILKILLILTMVFFLAGLTLVMTACALKKGNDRTYFKTAKKLSFVAIAFLSIAAGLCIAGTWISVGV